MVGLFGTHASIYTDIGLILVQLSTISALIARSYIKKKRPMKHMIFMISGVVFLYIFLLFYLTNYILHGVKTFGGPGLLENVFYYVFLVIHTIGASSLGLLSTYSLIRGLKRFDNSIENEWNKFDFEKEYRSLHKKMGKINIYLWVFTSISGIFVYLFLYVLYEPILVLGN